MSVARASRARRESVENFKYWAQQQWNTTQGLVAGSATPDRPFIVQQELDEYLKIHVRSLLEDVSPSINNRNFADAILEKAPRVFAILVLLDLAHYIESFLRYYNLCDRYLPFVDDQTPPPHFPTEEPGLFRRFYDAQWQFCAHEFGKSFQIDMVVHPRCILPITRKVVRAEGATSQLFEIEIHPAYDSRHPRRQANQSLRGASPSIYAMKVYQGRDAHECYMHEVRAFNHVQGNGLTQGIIGCFWGFHHGLSRSIILEHATGTLDHFLQCNRAPTSPESIHRFWTDFGNVLEGICDIHRTESLPNRLIAEDDLSPVLQGFHHDVKPDNVLTLGESNQGSGSVTFKIADLGLTRFRADLGLNARIIDPGGTRAYGAPEAARLDGRPRRTTRTVDQSVDVWSFGCICLEVACWLALPWGELLQFREARLHAAHAHRHQHSDVGCFHDGERLLACAEAMFSSIESTIAPEDLCTRQILHLIYSMLQPHGARKTSAEALHEWKDILNSASDPLRQQSRVMSMNMDSQSPNSSQTRYSRGMSHQTRTSSGSVPQSSSSGAEQFSSPVSSPASGRFGATHATGIHVIAGCEDVSRAAATSPDLVPLQNQHSGQPLQSLARPAPSAESWPLAQARSWFDDKKAGKAVSAIPGEKYLIEVGKRDIIFLFDDVQTMAPYVDRAAEVTRLLAYLLKRHDDDGIELWFTGRREKVRSRTSTELEQAVKSTKQGLERHSDMAISLSEILTPYRQKMAKYSRKTGDSRLPRLFGRPPKKLMLYVLTDGIWRPGSNPHEVINKLVETMTTNDYERRYVGIQFIRFGDNLEGQEKLQALDDCPAWVDMDIVDTEPWDGDVIKMAVGPIDKGLDKRQSSGTQQSVNNDPGTRLTRN